MIIKIMQNLFKNRYVKAIKCVIFFEKTGIFFQKMYSCLLLSVKSFVF